MIIAMIPLMILAGIATHMTARRSVARQAAAQADNPQTAIMNKLMLYVFPLGVIVGAPFFPLAILFYWLANNIWTFGQLYVVYRKIDSEESAKKDAAGGRPAGARPRPGQKPVRPETRRARRRRGRHAGAPAKTPGAKPVTRKPRPAGGGSTGAATSAKGTANGDRRSSTGPPRRTPSTTARAARRARGRRPVAGASAADHEPPAFAHGERSGDPLVRVAAPYGEETQWPKTAQDEVTEGTAAPSRAEDQLVREGDIAGDYLERLLDILDYDGDIDLDVEAGRAVVDHRRGRGPDKLVGDRGRGAGRAAGADPAGGAAVVGQPQPADAGHRRLPAPAARS